MTDTDRILDELGSLRREVTKLTVSVARLEERMKAKHRGLTISNGAISAIIGALAAHFTKGLTP